jgi:hypothetical protein
VCVRGFVHVCVRFFWVYFVTIFSFYNYRILQATNSQGRVPRHEPGVGVQAAAGTKRGVRQETVFADCFCYFF